MGCAIYGYRRWVVPTLTRMINQEQAERHDAMMRYRDIQRKIHTVHDQCAQQDIVCTQLRAKVSKWCSQMALQRTSYRAEYDRRCALFAQREDVIITEQMKSRVYTDAVNSIMRTVEQQVQDRCSTPDVRAHYMARAMEKLCRR